jgi:stage V sporulation protein S
MTEVVLRVASTSDPRKVAGAIAHVIREGNRAQAHAIGAGAVNQAIKAVTIARFYLATDGIDVVCIPGFIDVEVEGREITAVTLTVEPRGTLWPPDREIR